MIFNSRKDALFSIIFLSIISLLLWVLLSVFIQQPSNHSFSHFLSLAIPTLVIILLLWICLGTNYKLTTQKLFYKSGPIRGSVSIDVIKEIIPNKTLWTGLKPATAQKGLIIKYNIFDEIYISPSSNKLFIEELIKLNPSIKINLPN